MVSADQALIGFYAINAHAVHDQDLPKRFARSRAGHGFIPAAFIAMIGRDQRHSGAGFGADLLVDALDCADPHRTARRKALYESYGFQPLPSKPTRLFLPLNAIRELLAETASTVSALSLDTATPGDRTYRFDALELKS